ncbi:MAG: DUF342 domain-containing protein [Desulfobacteraceae bacterium]|nr:MAG: DUF342 domain-containing protein [Desulfobacteraceae bacterium]
MAPEKNEITISCTFCGSTYRIPDHILGKMVTCKKCRQKFKAEPVSAAKSYPLLGRIALENRLVQETDLIKAISMQKAVREKTGKELPLEEILLKQGVISESKKSILMITVMRQLDKEFCRIAVNQYNVSQEQADRALDEQAKRFKNSRESIPAGTILLESGALTRQECNAILMKQGRNQDAISSGLSETAGTDHAGRESVRKNASDNTMDKPPGPDLKIKLHASAETASLNKIPPALDQDMSEKMEVLKDKKFFHIRNLDKKFGNMVIDDNLATREEVDKALEEQLEKFQSSGMRILIGNILVRENILTPEQRDAVLVKQERLVLAAEKFGQIGIKKGFLIQEDVDKALQEQEDQKEQGGSIERIGEILVRMSALTSDQRDEIIKAQTDALIQMEDDDEPDATITEAGFRDIVFEIIISRDRLRSYLRRKSEIPESLDVYDLKDFLMDHKIVYGLVDDTMLEGFLRYEGYLDRKFKIAQGKFPKTGRPGKIKYYFDTEHLKVGALGEGGQIDYKDRGEIPFVQKGTLLAEKIHMIEGEQGIDVFGHPIHPEEIRDISLKAGPGVELFEDGQKAFAKVDGQPGAEFGGKVSVLSELKIKGDVGYETGHIDFNGNVNVSGVVQSGFRVKASSLTASEIGEAEIELSGDLKVTGGVNDAKIHIHGNMKAKYLKNATISAYGDVDIDKEIIDSKIDTSGMCVVKSGKIISSEIAAKKGILAKQIGTDMSSPCTLWIGVDSHMDKEIEKLHVKISELQQSREELLAQEQGLEGKDSQLQLDIANYAQIQDRSMVEKRDLEKKLKESPGNMEKGAVEKIKAYIQALDQKAKDADATINQLFAQQDQLEEKKNSLKTSVMEIEKSINDLKDEKQEKLQWSINQKQDARVSVSGGIYEGTKIFGQNASIILNKDYKRAEIKEVRTDPSRSKDSWIMRVE